MLLQSFHTMIVSLQLYASAYGAENKDDVIDLRAIYKTSKLFLALVELGLELFTRRHVIEVMHHLGSTFKD